MNSRKLIALLAALLVLVALALAVSVSQRPSTGKGSCCCQTSRRG